MSRPETFAVRRAGVMDHALLAAIHEAAFPLPDRWGADVFHLQLALPNVIGLVHPDGGLILCRIAADEAEVLTLAVAPDVRRRGLAKALLAEAASLVAHLGAASLFLEVAVGNAPARSLYAGMGFSEVGRRRNYYPDRSDALVLRLDLPPPS